ncbi:MAG TPA: DUF2075 domain-containing protein, partial [Phaeodactylibacter sp.]|nr:DUF2075 domain-containing protein [Phaeodactylibacter sp.]
MNTNMQLTPQQQHAFQQIKDFIRGTEHQIFILKGYAGTGKTTLIKFVLDWLEQTKTCRPILLASTGRAAKVLENKAKYQAGTVHGHIYSFDVMDTGTNNQDATLNPKTGQLSLNFSLKTAPQADTKMLYIVDEASMLSHLANTQNTLTKFGSGNLLLDLFNFAQKHKIIFIGDPVQLPPPSGNNPFSPALDHNFLQQKFNKKTTSSELTQIIRQAQDNPILTLATTLRQCVNNKKYPNWEATLSIKNQHIQQLYTQNILTDRYLQCVGKRWDKAIILTHSNKQAFYLNKTMRSKIFKDQPPHHLIEGELLMVTQNSYYVPLSNGDQVIVRKVKAMEKRAGFAFLKVEIEAIHDHQIYNTLLLHDFLFKPEAN